MNSDIILLIECEKTKQKEVEARKKTKQKEIEERIEMQRTEQLRIQLEIEKLKYQRIV